MNIHEAVWDFIVAVTGEKPPIRPCSFFAHGTDDDCIYYQVKGFTFGWFEMETQYLQFLKENFSEITPKINNLNWFILNLLHELGHFFTDDDSVSCQTLPARRFLASADMKTDRKTANEIYFNLVDEYEATAWAMNFIDKNTKFCELWDEIFVLLSPQYS